MSQKNILLIMAGGTGGHIFPALAVATELLSRGWKILWMGNPDGMEAQLVPRQGIEMVWVRFSALRGKGLLRKCLLPLSLGRAFVQAGLALWRHKPAVVLGMGGYISFPGGVMARLLGVPLIVHEQNAIAGLANRVLTKIARSTLSGFPAVLPHCEWVGNPVRAEIAALPQPSARFAALSPESPRLRLLVIGGSLGAQVLNERIPQGITLLPEAQRPEVIHQAGEKWLVRLRENYERAGMAATCVAFITDMAAAYAWADVVICRAGALTIAELAAAGVPAILVPFPFAVDDHQKANAAFLADAGAALCVAQADLSPERIAGWLLEPRSVWQQMAIKARTLAKPGAASVVADRIEEIAG